MSVAMNTKDRFPETRPKPERVAILEMAAEHVGITRNGSYGEPGANFRAAAGLVTEYLKAKRILPGMAVNEHDIAIIMALVKIARIATKPDGAPVNKDTYQDLAGYAAIAGELSWVEQPERNGSRLNLDSKTTS